MAQSQPETQPQPQGELPADEERPVEVQGEPNEVVQDEQGSAEGLDPDRLTYQKLRNDPEIVTLIEAADGYLKTIGYTDHGLGHVGRVATRAFQILKKLGCPRRECELAAIAGFLHDIGNVVHRVGHPNHSAIMCFHLLRERGMSTDEVAIVIGAIANHDDQVGDPVSNPSAALNIADKSDVLRSRVRNPRLISFDIHDRVNYAAEKSELHVDKDHHLIRLNLQIDTNISQVMEYFEIFISRMRMCRKSAIFLNCDFHLVINDVPVT